MREQLDKVLDRMYRGEITLGQAGDWLATHGESLSEVLQDKDIQIRQLEEEVESLEFENDVLQDELMLVEMEEM